MKGLPAIFRETIKSTRPLVFWPPVILLLSALAFSLLDFDGFYATVSNANQWVLTHFDWLFSYASFAAVGLVGWVVISPLGAVRIGGPDAKPLLNRWNWFSITLCTTIATGILFWGIAEPMFHIKAPPGYAHIEPYSDEASKFALSSMFMHWTITPYALYTVPALAFALTHYNLGRPYSLSGPLSLIIGKAATGRAGALIDAVGLYALVAGVAASLGAGVMTLAGGLEATTGLNDTVFLRLWVTIAIVVFFVASSISGLQRGIKFLSDINIRFFLLLVLFVFIAGPTWQILSLGAESVGQFVIKFIPRSLALGGRAGAEWTRDWTVFYFANWLAWAPVTALFLGRIALGYTVREFVLFNLVAPATFGGVWMMVFGGAAIGADAAAGHSLVAALDARGPEAVAYALFNTLPFSQVVIGLFIALTFISFVTAMDSNTHSITNVCLKKMAPGQKRPLADRWVKIFWGALIGAVAFIMTSTTGIDGVRMLSNLGGLPGLFILIAMGAVILSLRVHWLDEIRVAKQPASAEETTRK
ncbi:BCCT family transporter [Hyphococcus sp.]|uniref:BCCT family transporter n=1 Tax=Hyphococcus sp. TaxID=2038636 RepID=UPI00208BBC0D|nr:MAG: BCCT family transporter [Marinicaulis sp.]